MRNLVWVFALVGMAAVAVHTGKSAGERKVSTDLMNITEIQMRADKNMPITMLNDPM